jgi:hypothetical protein
LPSTAVPSTVFPSTALPSTRPSSPNVQLASNEGPASEIDSGNEAYLELKELDKEAQLRLRAYLNQHDRMARMRSNARLVNFPNQTNK